MIKYLIITVNKDINDTLLTYTCITVKFLEIKCGPGLSFLGISPLTHKITSKMNYLFIIHPSEPILLHACTTKRSINFKKITIHKSPL